MIEEEQIVEDNEIHHICKKYGIENYTINNDGSIDIGGHVNLRSRDLEELPLKFNVINGDLIVSFNRLTSLKNFPRKVYGKIYCSHNYIENLINSPCEISSIFDLYNNPLKSLKGYNLDFNKLLINIENKSKLIRSAKIYKVL